MLPELTVAQFLLLSSLGLSVGIIGAIVGVGGGFLLVPALLFIFPEASPASITSISLTAVFFNSLSASIGYRIRRNQDFRTAVLLIITAAPAAILGAYINQQTGRGPFELIFGFALIFGAVYLIIRSMLENSSQTISATGKARSIIQRDGRSYEYRVNEPIAASVAPLAGFVAGFFGIGGGIINVPFMLIVLRIPANIAVATSQLELTVASAAALLVHVFSGVQESNQWTMAAVVGFGTLIGAQIGVRIAPKVGGRIVLGVIGLGLLIAGTRLLATSLL
tara:strand:- start:6557 stop:7393 length:837 start_codon:yes stop_codon:yes gene_type:complete